MWQKSPTDVELGEQMTVELPLGKVGTYKRVGGTPLGGGEWLSDIST